MQPITIYDRLPVSGLRRDTTGNLIGIAKAARTGIQEYAGYELGMPDKAKLRLWRPASEVFAADSMRTYASAPVTIEHPGEPVTPANWRDHSVGEASDEIVRDGEIVKVPFMIRDQKGQQAVEDGKHEVSMGYTSMIDFTPGTVPDGQADAGQAYDAVQRTIRINHLAIVDKARGGPELRIGDSRTTAEPERKRTVDTKTILVDGLQVEVTDAAEAAINKLQGEITGLKSRLTDSETKLADSEKAKGEAEGKVTVLEQQVKDATNPANLAKAAQERADLCAKAKAAVPAIVTDGKDNDAIVAEVVKTKLGDSAPTDTNQIAGAFAALTAGLKTEGSGSGGGSGSGKDVVASIIGDGAVTNIDDAVSARDKAKQARMDRFAGIKPDASK